MQLQGRLNRLQPLLVMDEHEDFVDEEFEAERQKQDRGIGDHVLHAENAMQKQEREVFADAEAEADERKATKLLLDRSLFAKDEKPRCEEIHDECGRKAAGDGNVRANREAFMQNERNAER